MFNKHKKKEADILSLANEYYEIADLALYRIDSTVDPNEFFASCSKFIEYCGKMLALDLSYKHKEPVLKMLLEYNAGRSEKIFSFIDRLYGGARIYKAIDKMLLHRDEMSNEAYDYFLKKAGLKDNIYNICKVCFDGGKTYYYVCTDNEVRISDKVYVPVGDDYEEEIATVVSLERCTYETSPYPINKIKGIFGIAIEGSY